MLNTIAKITNEMGNLEKAGAFSKAGMSKTDAISATVSGATGLIGLIAGQAVENKRIMDDYYSGVIKQQQEYNFLLNDQLRLNSDITGSVFLKDYQGKLNSSTKAYNDAQVEFAKEFKKFQDAQAIIAKKNVVSGTNVMAGVGSGALAGAGIGALLGGGVLSVPAAAAGAIVGSVVGLISGLFAKKSKDVVTPILDKFPLLINKAGEFNVTLAKTLVDTDQITEATNTVLKDLIEWKEKAEAARAQLTQVVSDLAGSLGDDLRNALVDAFKAGSDAAEAFKGSVDKVLENIMSNMIFNQAFAGAFKTLEDAMTASYAVGGDQSWLDDFQKFYAQSPELIKNFNQGMADAQTAASAVGFSVFTKPETTLAAQTGLSGQIQRTITETTGNELVGLMRKMSDDGRNIKDYCKIAISQLDMIQINTLRTADNTDRLEAIETGIGVIARNTKQTTTSRDLGGG